MSSSGKFSGMDQNRGSGSHSRPYNRRGGRGGGGGGGGNSRQNYDNVPDHRRGNSYKSKNMHARRQDKVQNANPEPSRPKSPSPVPKSDEEPDELSTSTTSTDTVKFNSQPMNNINQDQNSNPQNIKPISPSSEENSNFSPAKPDNNGPISPSSDAKNANISKNVTKSPDSGSKLNSSSWDNNSNSEEMFVTANNSAEESMMVLTGSDDEKNENSDLDETPTNNKSFSSGKGGGADNLKQDLQNGNLSGLGGWSASSAAHQIAQWVGADISSSTPKSPHSFVFEHHESQSNSDNNSDGDKNGEDDDENDDDYDKSNVLSGSLTVNLSDTVGSSSLNFQSFSLPSYSINEGSESGSRSPTTATTTTTTGSSSPLSSSRSAPPDLSTQEHSTPEQSPRKSIGDVGSGGGRGEENNSTLSQSMYQYESKFKTSTPLAKSPVFGRGDGEMWESTIQDQHSYNGGRGNSLNEVAFLADSQNNGPLNVEGGGGGGGGEVLEGSESGIDVSSSYLNNSSINIGALVGQQRRLSSNKTNENINKTSESSSHENSNENSIERENYGGQRLNSYNRGDESNREGSLTPVAEDEFGSHSQSVIEIPILNESFGSSAESEVFSKAEDEIENTMETKLPSTVHELMADNGTKVYLIGTAHFSKESQLDVIKTIERVRPSCVMLELCHSRRTMLSYDEETILKEAQNMSPAKIRDAIRKSGAVQGCLHLLLLSMTAQLTKKLGMAPGGEFRVALRESKKIQNCTVLLGDRDFKITLARAMASLSIYQRLKIAWQFLTSDDKITKEDIEACKEKDMLEKLLLEMAGEFPSITRVLLDERDIYLAHSLWLASTSPSLLPQSNNYLGSSGKRAPVVGVVGIGHVAGIIKNWGKTTEEAVAQIIKVPEPTLSSIIVGKVFKLTFYGLIGFGAYKLSRKVFNFPSNEMLSSASTFIMDKIPKK